MWEPFLLSPSTLDDAGTDLKDYMVTKYGAAAAKRFLGPESPLHAAGRNVGIEFRHDRIYPTTKAHALVEHIKLESGDDFDPRANAMMLSFFRRYFESGESPNGSDTLRSVAEEAFGDSDEAGDVIERALAAAESEEMWNHVREKDSYHKRGQGVSGVPFFVVERLGGKEKKQSVTFSGAYPPDIIAMALEEMAEDS